MLGILYYLVYVVSGLYIGDILFNNFKPYERLSISLAIGTILSVWLPAAVSLIKGKFDILSNILALVLLAAILAGVYFYNRKSKKISLVSLYKEWDKKEAIKIIAVIAPLIFIIYVIFHGHVLFESNGNIYGGQSTFGDLSMHMGMITSIAKQGTFPPEYSILPGNRLGYPFLVNLQSATMYIFGTSLRLSIILPSMVLALSCFLGVYSLAREFTEKHSTASLALYMFFITGGLGFVYYFNNDGMMHSLFNDYYMAPTNYPPLNLRWVNVICDMLVPQRTFLIGLSVVVPILLLIKKSVDKKENLNMLFAGIMAASLPMIHTHSFLALGIICAGLLIGGFLVYDVPEMKWLKKWGIFLIPVVVFAAPQLFFWIFTQSQHFLRLHLDWVNNGEFWLWFWTKNIGITFLLIVPAFIYADKTKRLWLSSATVIFLIAEFIAFQPNAYDNNKLMLVWYVFVVIVVAEYLMKIYHKLKGLGRVYIAILTAFVLFISGILTIGREINSNAQYMQYSEEQINCSLAIDESTPVDSLFVTGNQHLNEIAALAGRNIYAGSTIYVHFHGLNYVERYAQIKDIYENIALAPSILDEIGADYIYISSYEYNSYDVNPDLFSMYPVVYKDADISILAVSKKAQEIGQLTLKK
ncbi:MAG: hypothetical protein AB1Z23_10685 [Eubacteriales bacterium]